MFIEYESKPIKRLALKITKDHKLKFFDKDSTGQVDRGDEGILQFACYEEPSIGDYVVYLNDSDIYHCSNEVFIERNIVENV